MESLRSPKAKATLAFLLVFLLGGGTGYVAGFWHGVASPWYGYGSWWGGWRGRQAGAPAPRGEDRYDARTERFLQRLGQDLKLNPEQSKRADAILRRHHERFIQLRREMAPRIDGILQEVRTELRSMMEPGQREHFDRMVRDMEQHRMRWRERRWGSPRGGMGQDMGPMMRGQPGPPEESR
ncbi:MAG: hypothetical protein A3J27_00770 [Candidatus Tectomicrobia bacterium RIFCSPLOWO2_12_FULL_69_37]|nr:MAG: hypothetical protein A3J27_00770 [Candidatus Tectomicrobia bacterium RIFCSPLOWO2_12_FULL_69_37]OGL61717.1 MAG: hypothetical protein A3I72_16780 [Candidatus Tectomicrobia bacterium RIFCSPLOWO2_02_FULL_70_19]